MKVEHKSFRSRQDQRGLALVVVLIVLASVSLLSIGTLRSTRTSLLMSGNDQVEVSTFQISQAALDLASSDLSSLPTSGPLNTPQAITLQGALFQTSGTDNIQSDATRTADCVPPPRARASSSVVHFSAFHYDVQALVDLRATGLGQNVSSQGYIILGPKCV